MNKMRHIFALIAVFSILIIETSSINYCAAKMCGNTNAHTFCQFTDGPSPRCTGYINAHLSDEEKARVIARLNRRRSDAASGRLRGLHPAGNMLKLRWVEELAREAQRWADQCRPPRTPEEHDVCRDLYSISVGQCVASVVGEAPGLRVESMVDMWYMQSMLYKGNVTFYVLPSIRSSYSDFGQMIWSKTYMVGCGRSRFMSPMGGRWRSVERLVCNFSPRGPPPARPLWSPAAPASACSARSYPDPTLTSLCTYQSELNELYDVDNSLTLEEHITLNTVLEIEGNESLSYHGSLDELYLTKIARVTIENSITTPYYNSVQKRDISDLIALEDAKLDVYQIVGHNEIIDNQTATVYPHQEISVTRLGKKKINLIGRPKTYNMEDLNFVSDHQNAENDLAETRADVSNNDKDLYAEYGHVETHVENTTILDYSNSEITDNGVASSGAKMAVINVTYNERNNFNNLTILETTSDTIADLNISEYYALSTNRGQVKQNSENYLNDPETVRELQEALDRMEQTLAPKLSGMQAKVRRDLRDLPPDMNVGRRGHEDEKVTASPEEIERNKTIERGPMMNMMLKYMPYLKHYESGLLGKAVSGSERISPSFVLAVILSLLY